MFRKLAGTGLAMAFGVALMAAPAIAQTPFHPLPPEAQVAQMGRGVNIIGYDPYWQDGAKGNYTEAHFKAIHDAGFRNIRVVLFTFGHMDKDGRLDPNWLKKLDWVVEMAHKYDLTTILDEHDFDDCSKDATVCGTRLKSVWSQLATRYKNEPNTVIFELLNEPHDALNGEVWNDLFPQVLATVRQSNPTRNVIVGPTHWNSRNDLAQLKLPEDDRHLIVTFHYYDPFRFTHQGASWASPEIEAGHDIPFGTPAQIAQVNSDFDAVKAWSVAHNRPIFLGEFGAYDKAAMTDRVLWTSTVARAAEARGFAFAYWQFSSDFIAYDFKTQQWVKPILDALIPAQ
jgi:endoglucanase